MKNNSGFGKFEVLTIIVVLLAIFAYFMYQTLGGASKQKFDTMKKSAVNFQNTVSVNNNTFHNKENVYLGEVIDEGFFKNISNPFGAGNCSISESKVEYADGEYYVTLKCGKYMIDKDLISKSGNLKLYEVGEWKDTKTNEDDEEKVLYNCKKNGKEIYPEYYEELYLVSLINKDNNEDNFYASSITSCEVVNKTFYRTKSLVK